MKKAAFLLAVFINHFSAFAVESIHKSALEKFKRAQEQSNHATAYGILEQLDPGNSNPITLSMKTNLLIHHHQKCEKPFAFTLSDQAGKKHSRVIEVDIENLLKKSIKRHSNNGSLLNSLAHFYKRGTCGISQNKVDQARAMYKLAEKKGALDHYSLLFQGISHYKKNDYKRAEQAFRKSIKLKPGFAEGTYNLAMALFKQLRDSEAVEWAETAHTLYKQDFNRTDAALLAAYIHIQLRNMKRANMFGEKALLQKNKSAFLTYKSTLEIFLHSRSRGILTRPKARVQPRRPQSGRLFLRPLPLPGLPPCLGCCWDGKSGSTSPLP